MRKFYCLLLIVLLCFPSLALGEENLLKNADFEAVDAGLPADWFEDAYYMIHDCEFVCTGSGRLFRLVHSRYKPDRERRAIYANRVGRA